MSSRSHIHQTTCVASVGNIEDDQRTIVQSGRKPSCVWAPPDVICDRTTFSYLLPKRKIVNVPDAYGPV
jgi:hypothetical protein